jgi:hypothetical protein
MKNPRRERRCPSTRSARRRRSACSPRLLALAAAGQVELKLKTPRRDGTTRLVMCPLEFMQRLAALVPRPRLHLIEIHGVLSPERQAALAGGASGAALGAALAQPSRYADGEPAGPPRLRDLWLQRSDGRTTASRKRLASLLLPVRVGMMSSATVRSVTRPAQPRSLVASPLNRR